jgi:hypothetical protein
MAQGGSWLNSSIIKIKKSEEVLEIKIHDSVMVRARTVND